MKTIEYEEAIKQLSMPKEVTVYNACSDPCDVLIGWFCACGGGHASEQSTVDKLKEAGYNVDGKYLIVLSLYRKYLGKKNVKT